MPNKKISQELSVFKPPQSSLCVPTAYPKPEAVVKEHCSRNIEKDECEANTVVLPAS
jgi:hypothetical protein